MKLTTEKIKQLIKEELNKILNEKIRDYPYPNPKDKDKIKLSRGTVVFSGQKIVYYVFLKKPEEDKDQFEQRCQGSVNPIEGESAIKTADYTTKGNPVGHFLVLDNTTLASDILAEETKQGRVQKYPRTKGSKDPIYNLHYCYAVGIENSAQATAVQSDVVGL